MKFTAMGKLDPIQVSLKHPLSDPQNTIHVALL